MSFYSATDIVSRIQSGEIVKPKELHFEEAEIMEVCSRFSDETLATAAYTFNHWEMYGLADTIRKNRFQVTPRSSHEDFEPKEAKLKIYTLNPHQHTVIGKYVHSYCQTMQEADLYRSPRTAIWEWKSSTVMRYDPRHGTVTPLCFSYTEICEARGQEKDVTVSSFYAQDTIVTWDSLQK